MRKRVLNSSQTSGRRPLPQASRRRCCGFVRIRRRVDEIAAQFADVLEQRAVVAHDVVPELARGEFLADHHRAAVAQHRAGRHQAAGGVIHRQAVVHAVGRLRVHHAGEGVARQHHAVVVDVGGLRHAGGAGRVDVERAVLDGERARSLADKRAPASASIAWSMRGELGALAVRPDLRRGLEQRTRGREARRELGRDDDVLRRRRCRCNARAKGRPDWC